MKRMFAMVVMVLVLAVSVMATEFGFGISGKIYTDGENDVFENHRSMNLVFKNVSGDFGIMASVGACFNNLTPYKTPITYGLSAVYTVNTFDLYGGFTFVNYNGYDDTIDMFKNIGFNVGTLINIDFAFVNVGYDYYADAGFDVSPSGFIVGLGFTF